jgi:hypothetical protein
VRFPGGCFQEKGREVELSGDQRLAQLEYLGDATPFASRLHAMLPYWPLFENLNLAEIGLLSQFLQVFRAQVGQEVIREGDAGDFMMFVIEGSIQVFKQGNNDAPRLIAVVGAGKTLGEMSLIDMKIGTPLSPGALRVMLLGAGELGKEVIIALQRLGVEVIAVDRYANAPGQQVAHRAHVIDMTDGAALRALIEQEKPHLIVPEIEAIATDTLVEIEAEGPRRGHPDRARRPPDHEPRRHPPAGRRGTRPATSPYRFADSLAELQAAIDGGIGYPCIVKPVMSSSGKGQSLLRGPADVRRPGTTRRAAGGSTRGG